MLGLLSVDPTEAKTLIDGLVVGDALDTAALLGDHQPDAGRGFMVGLKPDPKRRG